MIQDVQELLATTLADCPTFRTFVGAADAAAALLRIHHDAFPPAASGGDRYTLAELTEIRPCALVFTQDGQGFTTTKDAFDDCWQTRGILYCILYRTTPVDEDGNLGAVSVSFREIVGDLIEELKARSVQAGMLAARRISVSGPYRNAPTDRKAHGDEQAYELVVEWGVGI